MLPCVGKNVEDPTTCEKMVPGSIPDKWGFWVAVDLGCLGCASQFWVFLGPWVLGVWVVFGISGLWGFGIPRLFFTNHNKHTIQVESSAMVSLLVLGAPR